MTPVNSPWPRNRPHRLQHPSGTRRRNGQVVHLFESIRLLREGPDPVHVSPPAVQQITSPAFMKHPPPRRSHGLLHRIRQDDRMIRPGILNSHQTGWAKHRNSNARTDRGVPTIKARHRHKRSHSRPMSGSFRTLSLPGTVTVPGRDTRRGLPLVTECRNMPGKPEISCSDFSLHRESRID